MASSYLRCSQLWRAREQTFRPAVEFFWVFAFENRRQGYVVVAPKCVTQPDRSFAILVSLKFTLTFGRNLEAQSGAFPAKNGKDSLRYPA